MDILKQVYNIGIIPVIKINDASKAVPLAKALIEGGLAAAEVTFRTDAAEDAIRAIAKAYPDMLVGAGTVLTIEQAQRAMDAGAKFIVSPGFNPKVVKWCLDNGITPLPGCTTPSEIEGALELGLDVVKFFPAEQSGGLEKIKAMSAPYGGVKFMPTGGVSLDNVNNYLANNKILACGGSFMVKESYIDNDQWDEIVKLTKQSVDTMLGLEIGHIGINSENEEEAKKTAQMLSMLLGKPLDKDTPKSVFVTSEFEVMKSKGPGKCGHIAVLTNNVERAIYHLGLRGVKFNEESATFNADGTRKFIYLAEEFGGFGIHLMQKK
ncbi:MAG: bifunctional 4-hydroxy-2-oxoglutarate aldolase/2-dehydro-3-deoxy-phosphogluconate aldolase [Clostridia bacterium]|nr:bifunctional 4-hydroxy-2-oxoglutarate aldolase/2-dehydro-3-deoxy-phosphogluconate aldolase [Clostridia bacterium]